MTEHTFRPDQCLRTVDYRYSAAVCTLQKGHEGDHNGELVMFGERNVWLPGAHPVRSADWAERLTAQSSSSSSSPSSTGQSP